MRLRPTCPCLRIRACLRKVGGRSPSAPSPHWRRDFLGGCDCGERAGVRSPADDFRWPPHPIPLPPSRVLPESRTHSRGEGAELGQTPTFPMNTLRILGTLKTCPTKLRRLHSDESGVISLLTVFVMLGCTWLLLLLLNSARQLDSKVRLQNAADAAGQSGVGVLARGMNAIAFANHLEADLLAGVAVFRGAQGTPLANSPLVQMVLPFFEQILQGQAGQLPPDRPIPAFRRDIVQQIPLLADQLTREVARANGLWRGPSAANNPDGPQGPLLVQLWTTSGRAVNSGWEDDPRTRTLPVIDASPSGVDVNYLVDPAGDLARARSERALLVAHYLQPWALDLAGGDQVLANQLIARAQRPLRLLLDVQYSNTNLPLVLRAPSPSGGELERDLMFVAVSYRLHPGSSASRMFRNPNALQAPAMAFAQVHLFLPKHRYTCCPWGEWHYDPRTDTSYFISYFDGWPGEWSASTQNWQAKLAPATSDAISSILSSRVPNSSLNPPNWGYLSPRRMDALTHQ